ncbi:unnamed protein product [Linum trigynum]|uniref:Uncharacterized protein n=1 Tax=Linum trigynum TaxID=586398 RepID=A0AAV2EBQ0_9ROSI
MSVPKSAAVEDNGAQGESSSSSSSSSSSHPSIHNIAQKLNERMLLMKAIEHEVGKEQENTRATRLAFVVKFFEEVSSCKRLEATEEKGMMLTTWTERLQFAFLEGFLGKETFAEHIKVNKQLQSMFTLKMAAKKVDEKPRIVAYDVEREEVKSRLYKPELKWMTNEDGSLYNEGSKQRLILKKLNKSPTSWWSKARTQHMKKQRQVAATDRGKNIIGPEYD